MVLILKLSFDNAKAKSAAKAVLDTEVLATKTDLANLRANIIGWNTGVNGHQDQANFGH